MAQFSLGRGLSALIPGAGSSKSVVPTGRPQPAPVTPVEMPYGASTPLPPTAVQSRGEYNAGQVVDVPIEQIAVNPFQPRRDFRHQELEDLIQSIKEQGIIQPLLVYAKPEGGYELIAGERRLRAAKFLELSKVPVIIKPAARSDQDKLIWALIENIQRADLNPIEQAKGFQRLMVEFGLTQDEVAKRVGKPRPTVANLLRLLSLPGEMQTAIAEGKVSFGHAKVLLGVSEPSEQRKLFSKLLQQELTVRATESAAQTVRVKVRGHTRTVDPNIVDLERRLSQALGTKVKIQRNGSQGKIIIEFLSGEDFRRIVAELT